MFVYAKSMDSWRRILGKFVYPAREIMYTGKKGDARLSHLLISESEVLGMDSFDHTMKFSFSDESMEQEVKQVMVKVHASLEEKGYNPINQIVGYLLSGDPAYIPRHQDARNLIRKLERDEILEELVKFYIKHNEDAK